MGEVNVAQEELNSFLSVAEDLRVKGLTQNNSEARDPPPQPIAPVERQQVVYQEQQSMDMMEEQDQGTVALDESYAEESYDYYGQYDDSTGMMDPNTGMAMGGDGNKDMIQSKMWKNSSGLWQCTDCDHTSQHTTNMRNHIELRHVGAGGYYCEQCNKFCKTKNSLNVHRTRYKH